MRTVAGTTQPIFDFMKKDIERIDSTWGILDKLKDSGKGVDIAAINVIIQASVFFGDIQRAVGAYKAIPEYGFSATVETYNLLLSACIGAAHRELGDHILGEIKKPVSELMEGPMSGWSYCASRRTRTKMHSSTWKR